METNHIYAKPEGTPDNVNCPLCGYFMEQTAGLISCTNTQCPNYKGMAA